MSDAASVRRRAAAAVLVVLLAAAGCTADSDPEPTADPTPPPTAAEPPAAPEAGSCYRLTFRHALAPTNARKPTPCADPHTSETYEVGRLDTIVNGHLLAVDSDRAQAQVADACPDALAGFVGGDLAALRLSMVRPVWFTPSVEESDQGAQWYRCDAVVVAGDSELAEVTGGLEGVLTKPADRERYAMCGTAAPDANGFDRVQCSANHSWRAISVVSFEPGNYPGAAAARERGQTPCENAGIDAAEDPLDYEWGYEWPTKEQWDAGMTFGRCWAPD